jgi:hypothetical protein
MVQCRFPQFFASFRHFESLVAKLVSFLFFFFFFFFFFFQPTDGAVRATGLNGTDLGTWAAVWRTDKGARGLIVGADGKRIKSIDLGSRADDSMPSISALSQRGFVVAQRTTVNGAGVLKVQLFHNNGSTIRPEFDAKFEQVYGEPQVTGISEDRFVVQAVDKFSKLFVSVFWQDERINYFEVTSNVHSWKTIALSGDSYVIIVRDKADTVRLFAYRANSQTSYTIDELEVKGYISKDVEAFDVIALPNNHFTITVFYTPNITLSTFHFKDAQKLRDDGQQGAIPITTPQPRSNVLQVKDAASGGVLSRRGNGFAFVYRATDLSAKIAVFKNLGVANATVHVVNPGPGPQKSSPRVVGKEGNGFAVSFLNEDGTAGRKFLAPADFNELTQQETTAERKRQGGTTPAATTAPAPTDAATTTTTTTTTAPVATRRLLRHHHHHHHHCRHCRINAPSRCYDDDCAFEPPARRQPPRQSAPPPAMRRRRLQRRESAWRRRQFCSRWQTATLWS